MRCKYRNSSKTISQQQHPYHQIRCISRTLCAFQKVPLSTLQCHPLGKHAVRLLHFNCFASQTLSDPVLKLSKDKESLVIGSDGMELLEDKEALRRKRISEANTGKVPWNKGRRHSPETLEKIKARTKEAMQRPEIQEKIDKAKALATANRLKERQEKELIQDKSAKVPDIEEGEKPKRKKAQAKATSPILPLTEDSQASTSENLNSHSSRQDDTASPPVTLNKPPTRKVAKDDSTPSTSSSLPPAGQEKEIKKPKPARSAEHKAAIAEAIRRKWLDPEYRNRAMDGIRKKHPPSTVKKKREGSDAAKAVKMMEAKAQSRQAQAKRLAEATKVVQHLLAARKLVTRTEKALQTLKAKSDAFLNVPNMLARTEVLIRDSEAALAAVRARVADLESRLPPDIRYDSDGRVMFVSDTPKGSDSRSSSLYNTYATGAAGQRPFQSAGWQDISEIDPDDLVDPLWQSGTKLQDQADRRSMSSSSSSSSSSTSSFVRDLPTSNGRGADQAYRQNLGYSNGSSHNSSTPTGSTDRSDQTNPNTGHHSSAASSNGSPSSLHSDSITSISGQSSDFSLLNDKAVNGIIYDGILPDSTRINGSSKDGSIYNGRPPGQPKINGRSTNSAPSGMPPLNGLGTSGSAVNGNSNYGAWPFPSGHSNASARGFTYNGVKTNGKGVLTGNGSGAVNGFGNGSPGMSSGGGGCGLQPESSVVLDNLCNSAILDELRRQVDMASPPPGLDPLNGEDEGMEGGWGQGSQNGNGHSNNNGNGKHH